MNADKALQKLKDGNKRFVTATEGGAELTSKVRLQDSLAGQQPSAIVLGCSDSRVPAELIFHCNLGDLFVIRIAGNVVAPSQIGSVEFACQQFGTQLVVVLGHTHCGAISATVNALTETPDAISPNIASIVDRVTPAVMPLLSNRQEMSKDELLNAAMRANVERSASNLSARSEILRELIAKGELKIVGAEYKLETGEVVFYE